jgi:hypothetical protein
MLFAAMQRALGKRAVSACEYGWYFVSYGKPVASAASRVRRPMSELQTAADALFS